MGKKPELEIEALFHRKTVFNFRNLRKFLGWTQAEMAAELSIPLSTFQRYEAGKTKPRGAALAAINSLARAITLMTDMIDQGAQWSEIHQRCFRFFRIMGDFTCYGAMRIAFAATITKIRALREFIGAYYTSTPVLIRDTDLDTGKGGLWFKYGRVPEEIIEEAEALIEELKKEEAKLEAEAKDGKQ